MVSARTIFFGVRDFARGHGEDVSISAQNGNIYVCGMEEDDLYIDRETCDELIFDGWTYDDDAFGWYIKTEQKYTTMLLGITYNNPSQLLRGISILCKGRYKENIISSDDGVVFIDFDIKSHKNISSNDLSILFENGWNKYEDEKYWFLEVGVGY